MDIKWSKTVRKMPHCEFKHYTNKLSKLVSDYCKANDMRIDYMVPVLRSGAVPAVYIANKLNIVKFAPIQPKWVTVDGKRETRILMNSLKDLDRDRAWNLLVVEGTFSSGETVRVTIDEIKKTLPKAHIILACVVARRTDTLPKDVDKCFYGLGLNGRREGRLFVYPWEVKHEKDDHWDRNLDNIDF